MSYPDPTTEQMLIIGVAFIAPLVWAFKHHGAMRGFTLMLWLPLWLFVARVVYLTPMPTATLEWRIRWAVLDLIGDPLTIAWPLFVIVIYGLIRLFTFPRRRREARAQTSPQAPKIVGRGARDLRRAEYCPQCGVELIHRGDDAWSGRGAQVWCPDCGNPVPHGARHCPFCGYGIALGEDSLSAASV